MAAIPHLVGILCGHVYHFFTVVHPLMGAKRRLGAPGWMKRRLDGGDNPNFMEAPEGEAPRLHVPGAGGEEKYWRGRRCHGNSKGVCPEARASASFP